MNTARAALGRTAITVLDVETTGIHAGGHDRIIEVALVRLRPDTGAIEDEYTTLVNPRRDIGRGDIHGIAAGDLLHAPAFDEIAGDVGARLHGAIVAGHNVRFDLGFLRAEYARLGLELPPFPTLCTLHLAGLLGNAGSRNLSACCAAAGVEHAQAHTAMGDAHACRELLACYLRRAPGVGLADLGCEHHELPDPAWLTLVPSGRALPRDRAAVLRAEERGYLAHLVARLPHDAGSSAREAEYLCLLDRVLEDRALTRQEADSLFAAAQAWGMSRNDVSGAHQAYVWALARQAWADGVVTALERRDLEAVCGLLDVEQATLARVLDQPHAPFSPTAAGCAATPGGLAGQSICFTGELLGRMSGERVTREMAEEFARAAGMLVRKSVTRDLDVLVVADPDTQSGKARKARDYGIRIMAEAAFWSAIGAAVE